MALELLSQSHKFENSSKRIQISFDSNSFLEWTNRLLRKLWQYLNATGYGNSQNSILRHFLEVLKPSP